MTTVFAPAPPARNGSLVANGEQTQRPTESITDLPIILSSDGPDAIRRFIEFFTANIRNQHTRRAYFRNTMRFLSKRRPACSCA
jgi:hypothetical protein